MAQSLSARQRSALSAGASLADVEKVLADTRTAQAEAAAEYDRQKARSLDPHVDAKDAREARYAASDAEYERDRNAAAIENLERKVRALKERDEEEKRKLDLAAAIEERDLLVADLKRRFPKIIDEWVTLCGRIRKSDERLERLGVTYRDGHAEQLARGVEGNFMLGVDHIARLTKAKIPNFDGPGLAWPKPAPTYDYAAAHREMKERHRKREEEERAAREAAEEATWRWYRATSQNPFGAEIETRHGKVHVCYKPVRVELNPKLVDAANLTSVNLWPLSASKTEAPKPEARVAALEPAAQ